MLYFLLSHPLHYTRKSLCCCWLTLVVWLSPDSSRSIWICSRIMWSKYQETLCLFMSLTQCTQWKTKITRYLHRKIRIILTSRKKKWCHCPVNRFHVVVVSFVCFSSFYWCLWTRTCSFFLDWLKIQQSWNLFRIYRVNRVKKK